MQLATVIGHATSTIKHPSFNGWRFVMAQPLDAKGEPESDPLIVVDRFGSGPGQTVILNTDGEGAREYIGDPKTPGRWYVIGIVDEMK